MKKIPTNFRLKKATLNQIRVLAKIKGKNYTDILEDAIHLAYLIELFQRTGTVHEQGVFTGLNLQGGLVHV